VTLEFRPINMILSIWPGFLPNNQIWLPSYRIVIGWGNIKLDFVVII
jgi:hypothetical protein